MANLRPHFLNFLLGFLLVCGACTPSTSSAPPTNTDKPTTETTEPPKPEAKPLTPSAKLNHAGYQYAGIGYGKPLTYEFTRGSADPQEGVQTLEVLKNSENVIEVKRTRTGGLAELGEDTVQVTEKGVLVIAQSMGKMDKPALELPADVKPGSKWAENVSFDRDGQPIKQSASYVVLPEASVTVPAGTFTALPVELKGTLTLNGTTTKMSAKAWYVKDLGMVKMEMTTQGATKETAQIVLKSK